jgi:ribulose 1,5-bisphosphate carboxylase large subunit-like protein
MSALQDNADVAVLGGGPAGHPTLPKAMLEAARGFRDAAIHVHSQQRKDTPCPNISKPR